MRFHPANEKTLNPDENQLQVPVKNKSYPISRPELEIQFILNPTGRTSVSVQKVLSGL